MTEVKKGTIWVGWSGHFPYTSTGAPHQRERSKRFCKTLLISSWLAAGHWPAYFATRRFESIGASREANIPMLPGHRTWKASALEAADAIACTILGISESEVLACTSPRPLFRLKGMTVMPSEAL